VLNVDNLRPDRLQTTYLTGSLGLPDSPSAILISSHLKTLQGPLKHAFKRSIYYIELLIQHYSKVFKEVIIFSNLITIPTTTIT